MSPETAGDARLHYGEAVRPGDKSTESPIIAGFVARVRHDWSGAHRAAVTGH